MIDLEYIYIRGQGWVPSIPNVSILSCGTRVRAFARTPHLGEYYFHSRPGQVLVDLAQCAWVNRDTAGHQNHWYDDLYIEGYRFVVVERV